MRAHLSHFGTLPSVPSLHPRAAPKHTVWECEVLRVAFFFKDLDVILMNYRVENCCSVLDPLIEKFISKKTACHPLGRKS